MGTLFLIAFVFAAGLTLGLVLGRRGAGRDHRGPAAAGATGVDLDDLEMRAKVKGQYDVGGLADRLGKLQPKLARVPTDDAEGLGQKLRELFATTASSLRDASELNEAAKELATSEARDNVLAERTTLVKEAASETDALESGVDRVLAAAAMGATGDRARELGDLSVALDRQLEVARRVDNRMRNLEARARGDLSEQERYVTGSGIRPR